MDINIRYTPDPTGVAIMTLNGELDASNYLDVIGQVQTIYDGGSRRLVLDLSDLSFLSSSGLVSLHSTAMIMRGDAPPDPEGGWSVFHAIASDVTGGFEHCCKIYNPQLRARKTLELTGFSNFLQIYDDLDEAIASFEE